MTLEKLINFILALVFIVIPSMSLLMGALGKQSRMKSVMFVVPFISVLLIVNHQLHLQLVLCGLILPIYVPEEIAKRSVHITIIVPYLIFAGAVARTLMGKTNTHTTDKRLDIIMGIFSCAIVLWIAMRFPGFGSLGASQGGGWHALLAVSALCAYWGCRSLRGVKPNWRSLVHLMLAATVIGTIWTAGEAAYKYRSVGKMISRCFFVTGWWLYAVLLGLAVKIWRRPGQPMGMVSAYMVSAFLLIHAVMSSFRSRILFGPFMVGSALWVGGLRKMMFFATIVFFGICLALANNAAYQSFPGPVRRVLSVVRIQEDNEVDAKELGEMGRTSSWRMNLWSSAWEEIKKKPIIGHGYTKNTALFISTVTSAGSAYQAKLKGLVLSGEAHNTPINLMYYLGIPVASIFCFGWILHLKNLLRLANKYDGWFGAFLVALLVWTIAETGQALMNGTGGSLVSICTSMGIYQAVKPDDEEETEEMET